MAFCETLAEYETAVPMEPIAIWWNSPLFGFGNCWGNSQKRVKNGISCLKGSNYITREILKQMQWLF